MNKNVTVKFALETVSSGLKK